MNSNKPCKCPLCNQAFTPADGLTAAEHLTVGILKAYADMQKSQDLECPRCGKKEHMLPGSSRNALSRVFDIYICPPCGNDEALRALHGNILQIDSWWVTSELLEGE
jgi:predicted RNA-binding Zn-ribbon protein involved in translation (DUF1610 family)